MVKKIIASFSATLGFHDVKNWEYHSGQRGLIRHIGTGNQPCGFDSTEHAYCSK